MQWVITHCNDSGLLYISALKLTIKRTLLSTYPRKLITLHTMYLTQPYRTDQLIFYGQRELRDIDIHRQTEIHTDRQTDSTLYYSTTYREYSMQYYIEPHKNIWKFAIFKSIFFGSTASNWSWYIFIRWQINHAF